MLGKGARDLRGGRRRDQGGDSGRRMPDGCQSGFGDEKRVTRDRHGREGGLWKKESESLPTITTGPSGKGKPSCENSLSQLYSSEVWGRGLNVRG